MSLLKPSSLPSSPSSPPSNTTVVSTSHLKVCPNTRQLLLTHNDQPLQDVYGSIGLARFLAHPEVQDQILQDPETYLPSLILAVDSVEKRGRRGYARRAFRFLMHHRRFTMDDIQPSEGRSFELSTATNSHRGSRKRPSVLPSVPRARKKQKNVLVKTEQRTDTTHSIHSVVEKTPQKLSNLDHTTFVSTSHTNTDNSNWSSTEEDEGETSDDNDVKDNLIDLSAKRLKFTTTSLAKQLVFSTPTCMLLLSSPWPTRRIDVVIPTRTSIQLNNSNDRSLLDGNEYLSNRDELISLKPIDKSTTPLSTTLQQQQQNQYQHPYLLYHHHHQSSIHLLFQSLNRKENKDNEAETAEQIRAIEALMFDLDTDDASLVLTTNTNTNTIIDSGIPSVPVTSPLTEQSLLETTTRLLVSHQHDLSLQGLSIDTFPLTNQCSTESIVTTTTTPTTLLNLSLFDNNILNDELVYSSIPYPHSHSHPDSTA
ncbi:hypothetical protein BDF19DRAFT_411568 [Syncephalis fuscata]|nr:hypothetical protein BDF19DRAFT_411568 [Syncephalis fuscata]